MKQTKKKISSSGSKGGRTCQGFRRLSIAEKWNIMEKKRHIFVAGGAGYIGSACTEYLLDRGYEVTVFDSLVTGHRKAVDKRAVFIQGDLADRELLLDLFRKNSYDAVMHFAAFSLVGESMKDPGKYFRNNVAMPRILPMPLWRERYLLLYFPVPLPHSVNLRKSP